MTTTATPINPYVGPRTFDRGDADRFYGREAEARDLLALVVSQRLVLFSAQSGAGKSSLINTRLAPQLEERGLYVLPVGRVGGELPAGVDQVDNIYAFNLMLSLDKGQAGRSSDVARLTQLTLGEFLQRLTSDDGHTWYYDPNASVDETESDNYAAANIVLILDQFEEIITSHPARWAERPAFFAQLDAAMQADPRLRVVLTLREDYVAALDPYAHLLADKLRARFYMQRMGVEAALDAVKQPATKAGRPFAETVAETLVDNLRRIKVAQQAGEQLGQYVEPVQLQVVCYQLWQNLTAKAAATGDTPTRITVADLAEFGDVDRALANFYEDALQRVLQPVIQQTHVAVSEFMLRNWFSTNLITEAGTRGIIFKGDGETGGIPNAVVDDLAKTFLLRSELRAGGIWLELVHDRFVAPIVQANQAWIRHQAPLLQAVQRWLDAERDASLLLRGRPLKEVLREAVTDVSDRLVAEFLAASEAQAELEQRHFWNQGQTLTHPFPEFERSFAVVIQIPAKNTLSVVGAEPNLTLTRFSEALQTEHGYSLHQQLEDVSRHWLIELFTEVLPKEVSAQDRLLVYIAGTGVRHKLSDTPSDTREESFLVPEDGSPDYPHELIALSQLGAWVNALTCRHCLLIFDAVFTEPLSLPYKHNPAQTPVVAHQAQYDWYIQKPVRQIISIPPAASPAADHPFAQAFLQQLADDAAPSHPSGIVTASELVRNSFNLPATQTVQTGTPPPLLMWNLSSHSWGEYLFGIPGREIVVAPAPQLAVENNPYRGLMPYEGADAQFFFGRTRLIEELTQRVNQHPLTVVLGASGTGKSSLVKAGLAPHLRQLAAAENNAWDWCVLSPMRPVYAPLAELMSRLEAELEQTTITSSGSTAQQQADFIFGVIGSWLQRHPEQHLLLIVDQLEEVVTMCRQQEERDQFIQLMARLLKHYSTQLRIVFTVRSDFEPHFAGSVLGQPLEPFWKRARYVVTPMNRAELREVVEMPGAALYLDFQPPALVERLVDEVEQTPGALSLLSFSLSELYLKYLQREQEAQACGAHAVRAFTLADYDDLGGIIGSLSRRATELYERLDADQQATMQRVMLRMIAVEGGELARRRVPRAELEYPLAVENARVAVVVEQMAAAQLVLEGSDEAGVAYVEPAHDALVRAWDKLLVWKRAAEDILPLQRRLTQVATEWARSQEGDKVGLLWHNDPRLGLLQQELSPAKPLPGRVPGFLQRLGEALWPTTTITDQPTWLNRLETEFVQKSIVRRAYNLRQISGLIVAVVLLLALLAGIAQYNSSVANQAKATAMAEATRANEAEAEARTEAVSARQAETNARKAEAERATVATIARSRQLAALSTIELNRGLPDLALLVALEARHALTITETSPLTDSQEAYSAIRTALVSVQGAPPIYKDVKGDVLAATWDRNERRVLIRTDHGPVHIWNTETGKQLTILHEQAQSAVWGCSSIRFPVWEAKWSQDEQRILTRGADGTVRIWDANNGQELTRLGESVSSAWKVIKSEDGRCIYFNAETNEQLNQLGGYDADMWQAIWNRDEDRILTRSADGTARIWDATTGEELVRLKHDKDVWGATWNQAESQVLTYSDDDTARVWDATTGQELVRLQGHNGDLLQATWSQDERRILTRSADGTARIWDATTGKELVRLESQTTYFVQAYWSKDQRRVLTYSADMAQIWDAETGAELAHLAGHTGEILQATWSSDEKRVLTRSADLTVRIWGAETGALVTKLEGHSGAIGQATWSQDERRVLTTSADGTARIWDAATGEQLVTFIGHGGNVWEATWNQAESQVLTRGADDTVRIWDAATGRELVRFTGHLGYVRQALWSRDEGRVLTYSNDNTVRIWYTAREKLVRLACQYVPMNMTGQEWARFMGSADYRPTCPTARLPDDLVQRFQGEITALLQAGKLTEALARSETLDKGLIQANQREASMQPAVLAAFDSAIQTLVKVDKLADATDLAAVRQRANPGDSAPRSAQQVVAVALFAAGAELARVGDVAGASAKFKRAQEFGYPDRLDPEGTARHIAGEEWVKRGRALVGSLDVAAVTTAFQQAVALDPTLGFEPEQEAKQLIAQQLIDQGSQLALQGEEEAATRKFEQALALVQAGAFAAVVAPVHGIENPIVIEAQRLVQNGDIQGSLARFAAARARVATLERSHQLATASLDELHKDQIELALLLSLEARRALRAVESPTITESLFEYSGSDTQPADNAIYAALTRAPNRGPNQRIQLEPSARVAESARGDPWQATWSQDEQRILMRNANGLVGIWGTDADKDLFFFHRIQDFVGYGYKVWEVAWSQDEQRILTRGADGTARIWDAQSGALLTNFDGHEGDVWQATWSKDETRVLTRGADGTARVWDAKSGRELARLQGHAGAVWQATWSQDQQRVLTCSDDDTARIWDARVPDGRGKELVRFVGHTGDVLQAMWSQDERRVLTRSTDGTARIWDAATGQERVRLQGHTGAVVQAAWSRDEQQIFTAGADGTVRIWAAATGQELVRLVGHVGTILQATWSRDERRVLTRGVDGTVRVWDAQSGRELIHISGQGGAILQATWNRDENRLLTAGVDGTARLWDAATGEELVRFAGHEGAVFQATWSQDESRLLTRGDDRTVRIWDTLNGRELLRFTGHTDHIQQATWSRDESRVLTRSDDGTVRIWYTNPETLVAEACGQVTRNMTWADWTHYMNGEAYHLTCPTADLPADVAPVLQDELRALVQGQRPTETITLTTKVDAWLMRLGQRDTSTFLGVVEIFGNVVRELVRTDHPSEALVLITELKRLRNPTGQGDLTVLSAKEMLALELTAFGTELAQRGELEGAIAKFTEALAWNPTLDIEPTTAANAIAAQAFLEQGYALAKQAQLEAAIARFTAARQLDPSLTIEPERLAKELIAQVLFDEGRELADQENVAAALAKLDAALTLVKPYDPGKEAAINGLAVKTLIATGQRLAQQGDVDSAVAHFTRALTYNPTLGIDPTVEASLWVQVRHARDLLQQRAYTDAMSVLAGVAASQSTLNITDTLSAQEWNGLCRGGSLAGDAATVMPACGRALALDPQNAAYRDSQAIAFALTENIQGAIDGFETYIQQTRQDGEMSTPVTQRLAWVQLLRAGVNPVQAYVLVNTGQIAAALPIYTAIRALNPTLAVSAEEWNHLCWNGLLYGYGLAVLDACGQAVLLEPTNGNYRDSRGFARALTGDIEGAIADFSDYITRAESEATVHQRQAWIAALEAGVNPIVAYLAARSGQIDVALNIYKRVEESSTNIVLDAEDWNNLCWNGSQQSRAAQVLFACDRAVVLAPENGNYRDSRGVARLLTGDWQGALQDFEFAVQWAEQVNERADFVAKRRSWINLLKVLQHIRRYIHGAPVDEQTAGQTDARATEPMSSTAPALINTEPFTVTKTQQALPPDVFVTRRTGAWVDAFNLSVIPIEERPDQPTGEIKFVVRDIFTTRDGAWEPTEAEGSIDPWALEYLRPIGASDYVANAGGDHHLFAAVIGLDGTFALQQPIRYWVDGLQILGDSTYSGYVVKQTDPSGWANLPMMSGSSYRTNAGESGPWCWAPTGAAEVVCGGGLPDKLHVSTFVVWQAIRTPAETTVGDETVSPTANDLLPDKQESTVLVQVSPTLSVALGSTIVVSNPQTTTVPLDTQRTRRARVGLMGRNTSDFTEADYALLQEAKIEAIVLLSTIDPIVFAKIKRQNPDILIITRLYLPGVEYTGLQEVTPQQFIEAMIPVMKNLRPYSSDFQIGNEPNHVSGREGWGSEDAGAEAFNGWFLEVYQGLKHAHPWAQLGFPPLAVPDAVHRDKAWLRINAPAIEQADWLAVHSFWQTPPEGESDLFAECCGLNFKYYHKLYPTKTLHITEFGNSNSQNSDFSTDESLYANEYVQWFNEVFNYPYVESASAFIMSSSDSTWAGFAWREESGRRKAVAPAVGAMARPKFVHRK